MTVQWHKMTNDRCNLSKYIALQQILSDVQLLIISHLSISILVQSLLIEFKNIIYLINLKILAKRWVFNGR